MDFKEILVDIILNEQIDGKGGERWWYEEYVRRGYEGSEEEFYEEFVTNFIGSGIKELTKEEISEVAGGRTSMLKKETRIALATLLFGANIDQIEAAGGSKPQNETGNFSYQVDPGRKGFKQEKSSYAKMISHWINKVFNNEDASKIAIPILASLAAVFGIIITATLVLKIRSILNAETPDKALQQAIRCIRETIGTHGNSDGKSKKDTIVTALLACLNQLIGFVPDKADQQTLTNLCNTKLGSGNVKEKTCEWNVFCLEYRKLLRQVCDKLDLNNNPKLKATYDCMVEDVLVTNNEALSKIFATTHEGHRIQEPVRKESVGGNVEEPAEVEQKHDEKYDGEHDGEHDGEKPTDQPAEEPGVEKNKAETSPVSEVFDENWNPDMQHGSYTTEQLKNNAIISAETGITKNALAYVDAFTKKSPDGISWTPLTSDTVLVVCKNMQPTTYLLAKTLPEISTVHGQKNLYLVLGNCTVKSACLPEGSNIKVLDLRGNTAFRGSLSGAATVEKVLLRNNTGNNAAQLWLSNCSNLGPIYQLSDDNRNMCVQRLLLETCHLDGNFRFVNLNSCFTGLLTMWCVLDCTCLNANLDAIKKKSFDSKPDNEGLLKGVWPN